MNRTHAEPFLVGALALALACSFGVRAWLQTRDTSATVGSEPLQRVQGFDDLLPRTADEIRRADYFDDDRDRKLIDLWGAKGLSISGAGDPPTLDVSPPPAGTPDETLRDSVCRSAAVVMGHTVARRTLLTSGKSSLFTDYSIAVQRWFRPRDETEKSIILSFPGGEVELDGKVLRLDIGPRLPVLHLRQDYILFLRELGNRRGVAAEGYGLAAPAVLLPTASASTDDTPARYLARIRQLADSCAGR
jgi:hypothetical protein